MKGPGLQELHRHRLQMTDILKVTENLVLEYICFTGQFLPYNSVKVLIAAPKTQLVYVLGSLRLTKS